ncbi:aspartate racemase [Lutibacter sp. Hel_I_33_5]|uniref:aspartate/glutamate racemase family protein n=1 Tax=Lutibacter sp. Hel_I_33_5 TaxID=1566289 RepID=UPI00119F29D6|nr:aspartate/glutamate racemase family protein [Lutibacter sp. Hel_I_33_5]TVZ55069.1 aspartate racemase [Lutibacter sp. Hel_I_33_5]
MKTIGLIGGITPESTIMYYRVLNDLASKEYGGIHSAKVLINSVDFGIISKYQKENRWDLLDDIMATAGVNLEKGGASCIVICANTMHLCIDAIRKSVSIPVIHIAEATSKTIMNQKIKKVALLGTKYTMEKDFYKNVLSSFGIDTIIPAKNDRDEIHRVIYDELSKGIIKASSKESYVAIINKQIENGATGIILGCTEIPLLIKQEDISIPVFDTTTIHATSAFKFATL